MNESKCCGRCGPRESAGWKLVPVEPTEAMVVIGAGTVNDNGGNARWADMREAWAEMLAAAPSAPAQAEPSPTLPAGWVPLVLAFEPDYPEEIAYGPPRMMERLKKWLDKHFAARVAEANASAQAEPVNARLREALQALLDEVDGLTGESQGVYGLHLNGDPAPWDELLPGGRFERLSSMDEARAALAAADAQAPKPLTEEQIEAAMRSAWSPDISNGDWCRALARAAIAEFCRINGITAGTEGGA